LSFMTAEKMPIKDSFDGHEILRRKVGKCSNGEPLILISKYANAKLWDSKSKYYSWHALSTTTNWSK